MNQLLDMCCEKGVTDKHGRIVGWEHMDEHRAVILNDLLLLLNDKKTYPERSPAEELRVPEDISTALFKKIKCTE